MSKQAGSPAEAPQEKWVAASARASRWLGEHRRLLQGLLLLLVLFAAGSTGVHLMRRRAAHRVANQFTAAWKLLHPAAPRARPGRQPSVTAPVADANAWRQAAPLFAAVAAEEGPRGLGLLAALVEGDLYARLDDPNASLNAFCRLGGSLATHQPLYFLAAERLAYAHEARHDWAAAIAAWEPLANDEKRFYADAARYAQANLYVAQGDLAAAKAALQELEQTFPNSTLLDEAQAQLSQLAPPAPAGTAPKDAP